MISRLGGTRPPSPRFRRPWQYVTMKEKRWDRIMKIPADAVVALSNSGKLFGTWTINYIDFIEIEWYVLL